MKKLLIFLFIIPFISLSQINQDNNPTTHYYDWGYNTANQQINIEVGDTVEWTWVGGGNHNLISTSGIESFNSGFGGAGKTFSYTFNSEGSTNYVCTPHSGNMYGTVNVSNSLSLSPDIYNKHIKIYPNPTTSIVKLQGDKEYYIEVYTLQGKKVMALTGNTIDMSHLSSATYIVKALDKGENDEVSYKVVNN